MIRAVAAIALLFLISGAPSWAADGPGFWTWLVEEKKDPPRLEAELRASSPLALAGVTAGCGGHNLPVHLVPGGKASGVQTAVLFLIDTSDAKRARSIEAAKILTLQMIRAGDPRNQYAIYTFDSDLTPVADWGTPPEALAGLLKPVKARGLATELYRSVVEAVGKFEKLGAARRTIVLFSDGKAEDTTYTLEQALTFAANARTAVFTVGYAEAPQDTVHLQSLRRLAAVTGGTFEQADLKTRKVSAAYVSGFYPILESGGRATVDLSHLQSGDTVSFALQVSGVPDVTFDIPLKLLAPPKPDPQAEGKKVEQVASSVQDMARKLEDMAKENAEARAAEEAKRAEEAAAEQERQAAAASRHTRDTLIATGLIVAALAAVGGLFFYKRRQAAPRPSRVTLSGRAPAMARLQILDGGGKEHVIRSTALRVGRGKDNDLTLSNNSVSRHHAEISRMRDGTFTITELNAGNGIFINGKQVSKATLANEDVIELGEVRLRFLVT